MKHLGEGGIGNTASSARWRIAVAAFVAVVSALYVRAHGLSQPSFVSDFDQVWAASRALLAGSDPYAEIGPEAPFKWKWPLYYPLPALLLTSPLAYLPVLHARMLFAGVSAGIFTWAVSTRGWNHWPIFLSITFYVSVDLVQWSPLLASAFFLPIVGAVVAAKPNFALPIATAARTHTHVLWILAGTALLLAISFLARPDWLASWLGHLSAAPHFKAPVTRPFGFLLLLAVLKWRRPEARWLLGLSLIPQAPTFYDQLLLVAVCLTWRQTAILAAGTWVLFFFVGAQGPQPDYAAWGSVVGNATIWSCYLPCLVMLLRRPNEGTLPVLLSLPGWRRAKRTTS